MSDTERTAEMTEQWPHSIELDRDAKGVYRWSIKLRFTENDDYADIADELYSVDNLLRRRFLADEWQQRLEQSVNIVRECNGRSPRGAE